MTKLTLPKSALAHHIAVLGKTGSGKTSVVKAAVIEPALNLEERVCVIDPTGAWWGLRLKADGRSKGFPVYVFGGRHGDYPLLGSHGEAMADVIGATNTPAILDTSLMKIGERVRFFTEFSDAILRKNEGPLRIVIDEAHVFMPQAGARGGGPVPDMLHAGNNLISLGRSRGLRIVLISQRAAKLHKDSLTQVETMIACRLLAPQDRKAFREWIVDQANEEEGKEIIASLPKLSAGGAWVAMQHIAGAAP
jgi:DNA helicase HerA-like ATPase